MKHISNQPIDALVDPEYRKQVQGLKDVTAALKGEPSSPVIFSTDVESSLNRKMAQIQLKVAGDVAVEALKAAMTSAGIPGDKRADLIGYFCNEWNKMTLAIADAKGSGQNTEQAACLNGKWKNLHSL